MGSSKKVHKLVILCLTVSFFFASWGCVSVGIPVPQSEVNTLVVTATDIPTETPVPTVTPTLEPRYVVQASTEAFTSAQKVLNQSDEAAVQQERIQRWLDYWVKFDNRPFALESADIHWKYIYDDAKIQSEVLVLLEVGGESDNKLFTVPMNENGFVDFPPTVVGSTIEAGLGPLEIVPNKNETILSVDKGVLVRIDSKGEEVERLIQGRWEAVEKYPIDLEKLATPPKSFEELQQHPEKFVQAPNPVENFEEFIRWYNETLFEKALGGDLDKLPVNYKVTRIGIGDRIMARNETEGEVLSVPKFFYFKDQNQLYPSYVVTLEYNGYIQSYTVVMRQSVIEKYGNYQTFVDISEGERDLYQLQLSLLANDSYSEGQKKLYEQGFGSYPSTISEIPIGIGSIFCFDD